jgi:hypothetical protein
MSNQKTTPLLLRMDKQMIWHSYFFMTLPSKASLDQKLWTEGIQHLPLKTCH